MKEKWQNEAYIDVVFELRRDGDDWRAIRDGAANEVENLLILRRRFLLFDQVDFVLFASETD